LWVVAEWLVHWWWSRAKDWGNWQRIKGDEGSLDGALEGNVDLRVLSEAQLDLLGGQPAVGVVVQCVKHCALLETCEVAV